MMRDVEGYEGLYKVTRSGQVYSVRRKIYMKPQMDKDGYLCVNLRKDGSYKRFFIHRLVALAYVPNPEGKPTVNHIDEIKTNNDYRNLEWATHKENTNYGTRTERAAAANSKPVRCVETGVIYANAEEAAKSIDSWRENIAKVLNGRAKTHRGYHWEYVKEEEIMKTKEKLYEAMAADLLLLELEAGLNLLNDNHELLEVVEGGAA